ncbi:PIN domain-containing protein [Chroococcidiopsis sp. CCMEE 29]|uniref:type II toxin-antitoxin system VapC family toxin n=1 Tax=Chroococcidiopsis sp. CCMEE 29 TaxID=155894 RepID=UPI002020CE51|nr:PIN domain-containing protein [Chroococcidiopsis sp. CCMEE 29]
MRYVIDTHALIWFLEGNPRLSSQAATILADSNSSLVLPAIALAEAVWIVERGKTSIPSAQALLNAVNFDPRVTLYPLNQPIIKQTLNLLSIHEMHDRQIVATAILLQNQGDTIALLTCDQNITASSIVSTIW